MRAGPRKEMREQRYGGERGKKTKADSENQAHRIQLRLPATRSKRGQERAVGSGERIVELPLGGEGPRRRGDVGGAVRPRDSLTGHGARMQGEALPRFQIFVSRERTVRQVPSLPVESRCTR